MSDLSMNVMSQRKRRGATPWARKRRRLLGIFAFLVLLLSPALVWRIRLASEVRGKLTALRDAGRPMSLEELNTQVALSVPEENAATFYMEAIGLYRDIAPERWEYLPFRGKLVLPVGEALPKINRDAMEALVMANAVTLERLHEGAKRSQCHYRESIYQASGQNPIATAIAPLLTLLCCNAAILGEKGQPEEALRSLTSAIALTTSLGAKADDSSVSALFYRWKLEPHILAALQRMMGQADYTEEQLRPFREEFSPERRMVQWQHMCDVEQCLFLSRIREGESRGIVRNLLLSVGVGDLNLRAYMGLMAEVRAGFGLTEAEQRPHMARYAAWEAQVDAHPMLYMTLTVRFGLPPAHWAYMRARWDEAVVAETAISIAARKTRTGQYPSALDAPPPTLSDGSRLNYEQRNGGFRLWRESEGQKPVDCWIVVPTPTMP